MFDGVFEPAASRRRRTLAVRPMLPLLRAHARGVDVEPLAVAVAAAAVGSVQDQLTAWVAAQPDEPPLAGADLDAAIEELFTPVPTPTPEQVNTGRSAIADYLLTDEALDELNVALVSLLGACKTDSLDDVEEAAECVRLAATDALRQGYDPDCLRHVLVYWSQVTPGAPRINVAVSEDATINEGAGALCLSPREAS